MERYLPVLEGTSQLIREMQVERGSSALYIKDQITLDDLQKRRKNTDNKIANLLQFIERFPYLDTNRIIQKSLTKIDDYREGVEGKEDATKMIYNYTGIIMALVDFERSLSHHAPSNISNEIKSLLMLEYARENAGLLRAKMATVVSSNKKITMDHLKSIIELNHGVQSSLNFSKSYLAAKSRESIENYATKSHWNSLEKAFQSILGNFNSGNFNVDTGNFLEDSALVVDDIGRTINHELEEIENQISNAKNEESMNLLKIIGSVLFNVLLISIILFFAIANIKNQLKRLMDRINNATNNVSSSSIKLANSSKNLASSSQETAAAIQEAVSSMSEINSMVAKSREKSQESKANSLGIQKKVQDANYTLEEMLNAMNALAESNEKLSQVNKIIKSISKQTSVINDIVFKTQLLAVNASIEAAKAGAQGKGFAVVADEVSKLANLSGDASEKISLMLDESEEKVTQIIEEVNSKIDKGHSTSVSVKDVFENISTDVDNIKELSNDLAQAFEEQSLGIDQVTSAISQIDQSTEINTNEAQRLDEQSEMMKSDSDSLKKAFMSLVQIILNETQIRQLISEQSTQSLEIDIPKDRDINLADHDSFRPAS